MLVTVKRFPCVGHSTEKRYNSAVYRGNGGLTRGYVTNRIVLNPKFCCDTASFTGVASG